MGFNLGFTGLNAELNSICHLLALLEAHPILHVSRVRVKNSFFFTCWGCRICLAFGPGHCYRVWTAWRSAE